ncbi:MAG: PAS domain-containing protein, partial [Dongiaceae bacterium]
MTAAANHDRAIHQFLRDAPSVPIALGAWESGTLIDVNGAMADLLGVSVESLVGRTILEFYVDPERRASFLRDLGSAGASTETEVELR